MTKRDLVAEDSTLGSTNQDPPAAWKVNKMTPPLAASAEQDDTLTWKPSRQEWDAFVQRQLDELGLTYEALADQAARRDFRSPEALVLWTMIG
ncbi:hypothetical protein [Plantactinospora endophytica]|uniref:hypothetical protein n=1 Tax=Plantactinospora endophytica TaxID=673535 RepID=UPI001940A4C1|nr:hypothetical protein [Plantactinospora endophytica]